ncbi:MAG: DUF2510 domain-containing protein [Coriobacteriia bacterium]|nr:DUF2510 domain-containing protein [Coriobacteriia bacterium]MCL2749429.1 DUF2510 domain-containing protein [Coriobacteriia bacterium]
MSEQQAGWYPSGDGVRLRYFDGTQWTEDYTDAGAAELGASAPPVPPTQPAAQPAQAPQPFQAPGVAPQYAPQAPQAPPATPYGAAPPQAPQYAPQAPQYSQQAPPPPYGAVVPAGNKGKLLAFIAMGLAAVALLVAFIPILAAQVSIMWVSFVILIIALPLGIVGFIQGKGGKGPKGITLAGFLAPAAVLVITIIWMLVVSVSPEAFLADSQNNQNSNNITVTDPVNNNSNNDNNNNVSNENNDNNNVINVPDVPSNGGSNNPPQEISGDVIGQVGTKYATRWFDFTVNSMQVASSFGSVTAGSGNSLVIANVTITSTFDTPQPYGTFDWFVDDDSLSSFIYALDPVSGNNTMMPAEFTLNPGQTVTYDVVIEYPSNLSNPQFTYVEFGASGTVFNRFSIPIK